MSSQSIYLIAASVAIVGILAFCSPVSTKSIEVVKQRIYQEDPMLALPSGRQNTLSAHQQAQPQQHTTEIHYIYQQPGQETDAAPPQQQQQHHQVETQQQSYYPAVQNVVYAGAPYQIIQTNPQEQMAIPASAQFASSSNYSVQLMPADQQSSNGYPGEVVYVSPNEHSQQSQGEQNKLPTELAATILTEVPAKDLPPETLEKLMREYGVRVVATREHPGANLVINCDDSVQQDTSICAKQSVHSNIQPNYPTEPHEEHAQLEPNHYQQAHPQPEADAAYYEAPTELPQSDRSTNGHRQMIYTTHYVQEEATQNYTAPNEEQYSGSYETTTPTPVEHSNAEDRPTEHQNAGEAGAAQEGSQEQNENNTDSAYDQAANSETEDISRHERREYEEPKTGTEYYEHRRS